ncbi:hypothetical protein [Nonomuraea sp. KM90]|uniref:hypothetical protein n=1 Tax=Nonomuraea sp. KM90 TaxID=3457428 RepID=UPI003FCD8550
MRYPWHESAHRRRAAGRRRAPPGSAGRVAVSGFGSPETARTFVESGTITSTALCDVPRLGFRTVWAMRQLLDGRQIAAESVARAEQANALDPADVAARPVPAGSVADRG